MSEYVAIKLKDLQKLHALGGCEIMIQDDWAFRELMKSNPEALVAYHNALAMMYKNITKTCKDLSYEDLSDLDYYYSSC